jgi:hypothetical protein
VVKSDRLLPPSYAQVLVFQQVKRANLTQRRRGAEHIVVETPRCPGVLCMTPVGHPSRRDSLVHSNA